MVAALASRHQIRCVTTILLVLCEQPLPQTLHLTDCKSERQVKKSSCPKRLFVTKFLFFFFLQWIYMLIVIMGMPDGTRVPSSADDNAYNTHTCNHAGCFCASFFTDILTDCYSLKKRKKHKKKQMATYVFKWHNRSHLGPTEVMKDSESFTHRKW